MQRPLRAATVLLAAAALLAVPLAGSASASAGGGPVAQAAKKCSLTLSQQRNMGTTYVFSLSASDVSCRSARGLAKAYHDCRHRRGKGGSCGGVSGYSCSERRYNKSRFSYDATATCTKGSKKVVQKYQQNT
jgi:hypothetical protein